MLTGIDTSFVQRDFTPSGVNFTIINASRANNGGLDVGSFYHAQVDNARGVGVEIGHYFFNGDGDGHATATQCADFFIDNLYGYRTGDALVLDVEYEESTNTAAWTPDQVLAFAQRVYQRTGVKIGVYLNLSLIRGSDWSAVVDFGCWLWVAWPGDESEIVTGAWPEWTMWQYTIIDNLDRNYSKASLASLSGGKSTIGAKMAGKVSSIRATTDGTNDTNQLYWETGDGALIWIENPYDLGLLTRYEAASNNNTHDHYYPSEIALLNNKYLAPKVQPVDPATVQSAVKAAIAALNLSVTVDDAAIAKAVADEMGKRISTPTAK